MKRGGLHKITKRKKLWDSFGFGYGESPHYLWKNKHLTCNCGACKDKKIEKKLRRRRNRYKANRILDKTNKRRIL